MEVLAIALLVIVLLFVQAMILHKMINHLKLIEAFAKDINDYVSAYEHVKDIVNKNSSVFADWYDIIRGMRMEVSILELRTNIHGEALGIKQFQMPDIPVPTPENTL